MNDPLIEKLSRPEYAVLSDEQAADALNAVRVASRRLVPTWEVRRAAIEGGYWPALVFAAAGDNLPLRALAVSVLAWIDDQSGTIQTIDFDRPAAQAMLQQMTEAGLLTPAQAAELAALADISIPWTQSVGLPEIGIGLVQNARRSISG